MAKYRLGDIAPVKQGIVPDSDQYWLLNLARAIQEIFWNMYMLIIRK